MLSNYLINESVEPQAFDDFQLSDPFSHGLPFERSATVVSLEMGRKRQNRSRRVSAESMEQGVKPNDREQQ